MLFNQLGNSVIGLSFDAHRFEFIKALTKVVKSVEIYLSFRVHDQDDNELDRSADNNFVASSNFRQVARDHAINENILLSDRPFEVLLDVIICKSNNSFILSFERVSFFGSDQVIAFKKFCPFQQLNVTFAAEIGWRGCSEFVEISRSRLEDNSVQDYIEMNNLITEDKTNT